ncbi:unnamed protein product [Caenorhabditis sp. 36 PRJEB53466]|nr:unnamed protein product [Caenorhabditis sp. 36 PRJEB53466]
MIFEVPLPHFPPDAPKANIGFSDRLYNVAMGAMNKALCSDEKIGVNVGSSVSNETNIRNIVAFNEMPTANLPTTPAAVNFTTSQKLVASVANFFTRG